MIKLNYVVLQAKAVAHLSEQRIIYQFVYISMNVKK